MGLINRDIPKGPEIEQEANTSRTDKVILNSKKKLGSENRKNIKVSEDTFNLVKTIATMQSLKNYEFIDEVVHFYIENKMSEREQRILKNLTPK
ncbi:hypothetical protein [Enterococcus sp. HY326]|uniref:hypothetical protein n=1 Tax=Enterococcus sp. HY326 TaxID=2971265 RepID=UPI00223F8D20|nr:hypothetical protein [Enterococcus sp. HY326]